MAQVAACPHCLRELLVDDGTDVAAWAKCPECLAFFQLGDATWRVVHAAQVVRDEQVAQENFAAQATDATVDRQRFTVSSASFPTVSDIRPLEQSSLLPVETDLAEDDLRDDSNESSVLGVPLPNPPHKEEGEHGEVELPASAEAPPALAPPSVETDDPTNRMDSWFRAETARLGLSDLPTALSDAVLQPADVAAAASAPDSTANSATIEYHDLDRVREAAPDVELEMDAGELEDRPTWDDSEQMERLLADVEMMPDDERQDAPIPRDEVALEPRHERVTADESADESVEESVEEGDESASAVAPPLYITHDRVPRRRNPAVRMVVGTVTSGVVGLALGYYALLWLKGTDGDILHLAPHLPSAVLPADVNAALAAGDNTEAQRDEIQASYTAPVTPPDTAAQRDDGVTTDGKTAAADVTGGLRPFDEPTAQPLADALPTDGELLEAPTFTADQLAVSLQTAQKAMRNLVDGSLNDSRETQRTKGLSYSLMCDLAQKMVFVDRNVPSDSIRPLLGDAEQLFRQALSEPHTRSEIAVIVEKWIVSPHRTHGGVFFAGTLTQEDDGGSVAECEIDLGGNRTLTVLVPQSATQPIRQSSRPLGVVGWIVDAPADRVRGYTGSAPQAIWADRLIPLD